MSNAKKSEQRPRPSRLTNVFSKTTLEEGLGEKYSYEHEDAVQKIFDLLIDDFKPKDILEEIWLHDIARITANIENFRIVERAIQLKKMQDRVTFLCKTGQMKPEYEQPALKAAKQLAVRGYRDGPIIDQLTLTVSGILDESDLKDIAAVVEIVQKLQRERDRIYAQFERKRRPLIIASVGKVDAAHNEQAALDSLQD
jgi:hypothetical protein